MLIVLGVTACRAETSLPTRVPTAVFPSSPPPTPLITPVSTAAVDDTAVSPPFSVSIDDAVPLELALQARQLVQSQPETFQWADVTAEADIVVTLAPGTPLAIWLYVVAAPFAATVDTFNMAEAGIGGQRPFFVTEADLPSVAAIPALDDASFLTTVDDALIDAVWQKRPSLAIVPFHKLHPRLKVLNIGDYRPLDGADSLDGYPLAIKVNVAGDETAVSAFFAAWQGPDSNRDSHKMTRIAMSGVTALVRATAFEMEQNGVLYPGTAVAPVFQSADIAHISNEVAFTPDCPYPDPLGGTTFCSSDRYFALLTELGIDIVELTGNHLNDWGTEPLLYTLDLYEHSGIQTFGGGYTINDASVPLKMVHNGNQIAFVGCNPVGPAYAWATTDQPGSLPCDADIYEQIATLNADGYLVIATQQYLEFYQYAPTDQQQVDFRLLADAGASAVSGSQGHHAQGFDFHNGAFIHYGLGNLFFDQMDSLGTRQTMVDTYVVYDGRLLSVELWTGLIENFARPRQMSAQEREDLLQTLFAASGW